MFQLLVRIDHVPHFCLNTTGEETIAIYSKKKIKKKKDSAPHCAHKYRSLNT